MSSYGSKIYVGDLGNEGSSSELESAFSHFGPIRSVWVARNPPGFAFIEFEDQRDARDAVDEMDGRTVCGHRVIVEMADGRSKGRGRGRRYGGSGRAYDPNDRCYECDERGHYAYDCRYRRGKRRRSRSPRYARRSRSYSPVRRSRSYSPVRRSRSRSRSRDRRSHSRNGRSGRD